ncbi:MAG: hypothetical protein GY747_07275 [Planctomycetes bacterium]|nr:hypothetical protein [Planctomycetota bacterium]MCP4771879.1 hypothetical protein [Planctomycetota bacterium]MCP4861885.1 hypothetical protein [Planctomycetota bacterium]
MANSLASIGLFVGFCSTSAIAQEPADTYFSVAVVENGHNHSGANKLFLDFQTAPFDLPDANLGKVISREVAVGAITMDGSAADWDPLNTMTFTGVVQDNHPLSEFIDAQPTVIEINSVWDSNDVYFLLRWEDAGHNASVRKDKWIFGDQGNGESGWNKQLNIGAVAGTPNTNAVNADHVLKKAESEDRVFFMFPIVDNENNFTDAGRGCAFYCHGNISQQTAYTNYTGAGYSVMHTNDPSDKADIWHWKAARTEPSGVADDKYLGYATGTNSGRFSDGGTSAYSGNSLSGSDPTSMHNSGLSYLGDRLFDFDAVPFAGIPSSGDEIPASISRTAVGSRGDVQTAAFFDPVSKMWTVEFRRARDTGSSDDHQFVGSPLAPPTNSLIQSGNAANGLVQYEFNCIGCHKTAGIGHQSGGLWAFPRIQRASGSMIHSAIETVPMMNVFGTFLSDQDVEDIATYLQGQEDFRPTLAVSNLTGGSLATLDVTGAKSGDTVYFAYSLAGAGPTSTPWGFSLDLGTPYSQIGSRSALADGTASLSTPVPGAATGLHVWVQAVVRHGNQLSPSFMIDQFVQ